MRFARFGVTLERLQRRHLELVRQWRNNDWLLPHMRYREFIRPEDQIRWFQALDLGNNWHFVAHIRNVPFALFHIKDIDWTKGNGESGGFVGDRGFIGRPEPACATLALMDFAFFILQLKSLQVHYKAQLQRVARFNEQLGYQIVRLEADGFSCASVTAERYLKCAAAFRKAAESLHGSSGILSDPDPWLAARVEQLRTLRLADFELQLGRI